MWRRGHSWSVRRVREVCSPDSKPFSRQFRVHRAERSHRSTPRSRDVELARRATVRRRHTVLAPHLGTQLVQVFQVAEPETRGD
eukprot:1844701-Prymnesium_polylepis.1